ncbi:hypothetical protein CHUAL_003938 [Chamberlinius hualienensis]
MRQSCDIKSQTFYTGEMACCAVVGCSNNKKKNKDLKFYGFPKDEITSKQWVVACRRKDSINTKSARICSAHFDKSDFCESLRHRLLGYSPRNCRNLKPDAIPTVKVPLRKDLPSSSTKRSVRVEKRTRKRITKEILDQSNKTVGVNEHQRHKKMQTDTGNANNVEMDHLETVTASVENVENEDDLVTTTITFSSSDLGTGSKQQHQQPYSTNTRKKSSLTSSSTVPECECKCLVTAANILAAKSMIKLRRDNEELKSEINNLNEQLEYLKNERKNFIVERLKPIFTDGQIRCLFQPVKKRICWSDEDITSAITLRSVSPNAYRYLREKMNYPLPAVSTLRKWVRMKMERDPGRQILELVKAKLPSLASPEED